MGNDVRLAVAVVFTGIEFFAVIAKVAKNGKGMKPPNVLPMNKGLTALQKGVKKVAAKRGEDFRTFGVETLETICTHSGKHRNDSR